tara:strand:+ start:732 stop:3125 length:2394 start_codon:yes stop_codon:yes gene_type:complete
MRIFFLIISFIIINSNIYSQNDCSLSVNGKVLDSKTKEPLSSVLIQIDKFQKFAITDEEGNFVLDNLCSYNFKSIITRVGYYDSIFQINKKNVTIYLSQETVELNSVLIIDEKEENVGIKSISQRSINIKDKNIDPTQSLANLISSIDGVTFSSVGSNVEIPVIHGLYGNRILVLNNYVKHGFQNWGKDHAPEINISSAEAVTVIKGSSGVRFGPEGLGGAIIIEPNVIKLNNPFYLDLGTGFQTNGKGYNFNFKTGTGYKKFGYFLSADYIKIGDRHAPSYSLTNSGKEEKALNLGIHYHLKNFDIKMYYSYLDQNLALLRSSFLHSGEAISRAISSDEPLYISPFSYKIDEPYQDVAHHFAKAKVDWWYKEDEKISLTFGGQLNKRKEFDVRRNAEKPVIDLDLNTFDYLLEWDHSFGEGSEGLVGIHYFNQDNDNNPGTGTTPYIPNYNIDRLSFFILESKKFGKNLIEAGIRFDNETSSVRGRETNQNIFRDKFSKSNVTFSIGYQNEVSESFLFRSNFGSAWRTPNMAELYTFGGHGFKSTFGLFRYYIQDSDFNTERVIKMEENLVSSEKAFKFINEFDINKSKTNLKLTLFSNYILNYVFERPIGIYGTIRGPMPYFIYDQTDAIFLGSDFSFRREISEKITSDFSFNYLWANNLFKNHKLINQPPIRLNNNFIWNIKSFWKINSSEISLLPSYTFKQFQAPITISPKDLIDGSISINQDSEIFDFKDAPDGYFLLDLSWKVHINDLSFSFMVKNLLNKKYRNYLNYMRYYADEVGRNFIFNLSYSFKKK